MIFPQGYGPDFPETIHMLTFMAAWPWILGALAVALLISGIDDLIPVTICALRLFRTRKSSKPVEIAERPAEERKIAIFVPCWKESGVIGNMIRHNLSAIRYHNFDVFLGVYPNDEPTVEATEELARSFPNVHVSICPHPGPTSKADCLNWTYQQMLQFEKERMVCFDTIVLHDAEDLIHPESLALINSERATHAMVQVPVLPLPTPLAQLTHGVYCDEFAEFQTIDMRARQFSRSFIPSSGVGTGFAREILERLGRERLNCVFDPTCLTEDYEIGVYLHKFGYSQLFAPLRRGEKDFVATREFFPGKVRSAIRQHTRWVTGIALQGWERAGWQGSWRTRYWFWRDRKGLIMNPLSLLTNLLFIIGAIDWIEASATHRSWAFAVSNPAIVALCFLTLLLQSLRILLRAVCVGRLFGWVFAGGVPFRIVHGNFINSVASFGAIWRFAKSRLQGRPLVWLKTEHIYPEHEMLGSHRRELGEVLVSTGSISKEQLEAAQAVLSSDADLIDYLLINKLISDENLCRAISLQSGLRSARVDTNNVKSRVIRSLPAHILRRFGIVPFRIHEGRLHVAGTRAPSADTVEELKNFTRLRIEFQLVTRQNYAELESLVWLS